MTTIGADVRRINWSVLKRHCQMMLEADQTLVLLAFTAESASESYGKLEGLERAQL